MARLIAMLVLLASLNMGPGGALAFGTDLCLIQMTTSNAGVELDSEGQPTAVSTSPDLVGALSGAERKPKKKNPTEKPGAPETKVTVFFNIYQNNMNLTRQIVEEQIQSLQKRFDVIDQIRYITIGGSPDISYKCDKCYRHAHYPEGGEDVTLQLLFEHCAARKSAKVAYIHSKGSFNDRDGVNNKLRRFLMQGVLSEPCLQMPSQCNICGSRFSPLPHHHVPGNMWVAKCDYIRELIPPNDFKTAMNEFASLPSSSQFNWCKHHCNVAHDTGTDRYAFEHWVSSHPNVLPCDVYRGDFCWGYVRIPEVEEEDARRYEDISEADANFAPTLKDASQISMSPFLRKIRRDGVATALRDIWEWRLHEWKTLYHAVPKPGTWAWALYKEGK